MSLAGRSPCLQLWPPIVTRRASEFCSPYAQFAFDSIAALAGLWIRLGPVVALFFGGMWCA